MMRRMLRTLTYLQGVRGLQGECEAEFQEEFEGFEGFDEYETVFVTAKGGVVKKRTTLLMEFEG